MVSGGGHSFSAVTKHPNPPPHAIPLLLQSTLKCNWKAGSLSKPLGQRDMLSPVPKQEKEHGAVRTPSCQGWVGFPLADQHPPNRSLAPFPQQQPQSCKPQTAPSWLGKLHGLLKQSSKHTGAEVPAWTGQRGHCWAVPCRASAEQCGHISPLCQGTLGAAGEGCEHTALTMTGLFQTHTQRAEL